MDSIKVYFSDGCQGRQWLSLVQCAGYWAHTCPVGLMTHAALCVEASPLASGLYFPQFAKYILLAC